MNQLGTKATHGAGRPAATLLAAEFVHLRHAEPKSAVRPSTSEGMSSPKRMIRMMPFRLRAFGPPA